MTRAAAAARRLAPVALLALAGIRTAAAQAPATRYVPPPQAYSQPPRLYAPTTYAVPFPSVRPRPARGAGWPGGIGTTPFLGNTRGAGAYQVNYDAPRGRRHGR